MVLDAQRGRADKVLMPAANALKGVDPNLISVIALVLALVVGILTYYSFEDWELLLPIISILVLVSGFLDAMDGKVARLAGKAGKRGDFIDHVFDRYADIFMIGGVVVSSWCNIYLGILALLGVLMTSYMGTQAQALGIGRMYAGTSRSGRPHRANVPGAVGAVGLRPHHRRQVRGPGVGTVLHVRDHDALVRVGWQPNRGAKRHSAPGRS